ncbi:MAG: sensor histidine kinase [Pseudomonas sp.]
MDIRLSLNQRIVVVFALMSALVAGVFAIGIIVAVHIVERKLTVLSLGGDLHRLLTVDSVDNWRHRPQKNEWFYVEGGVGDLALTSDLKILPAGFQEITRDNEAYYAMVDVVSGRKYVLLRDELRLEKRERTLFWVVLSGFVLSVLLSILLGRLLGRRVMAPVVRLSRQVRQRDQLASVAPALASHYALDEVGDLAVSFDETLGRLRSALGREKLFTSDVSHELRTPLMVLASSCELLLENPKLDDRSRAQVIRISRASLEMNQLVETFLLLARVEGEQAQEGAVASLDTIAEGLMEVWGKPIADKGLAFIYVAGPPHYELFHSTLLHAVMSNLLRNAWHYTDRGFIRLTLFSDGFSIEDSGIGIPVEKQQSMFLPFVRGDEQRGEGLGLGLSLVQRICDSQGWRVTLTSQVPNGCCFHVALLPVVDRQASPLSAAVKVRM